MIRFFGTLLDFKKKISYTHRESNPGHSVTSLRSFAMRGSGEFYH